MTIRLRWIIVIAFGAALVCGLAAGAWASSRPDQYRVTATVAIAPSATLPEVGNVVSILGSLDRTGISGTTAGVAESRTVRDASAAVMGVGTADMRGYSVEAIPVAGASLVNIYVTGPDGELAAQYADAIALTTREHVEELYQVYRLEIVTSPSPPSNTTNQPVLFITAAGAVAGAALALVFVYALDAGQRRRAYPDRVP